MKIVMNTFSTFAPSDSGGGFNPLNVYRVLTDLNEIILLSSTRAKPEYVRRCLIDAGLAVETEVQQLERPNFFSPACNYQMFGFWSVDVVIPDQEQKIIFMLRIADRMAAQTIAALLSTQLSRHHVYLSKNDSLRMILFKGAIIQNNNTYKGIRAKPNDWV